MIIVVHDRPAIFRRGYGICSLVCGHAGGFKHPLSCRIAMDVRIWRSTFPFRRRKTWPKRRIGERPGATPGFKRMGLECFVKIVKI